MEMKQKLKRAAMKMFQGALTRSFDRWAQHVEEEKEMKQKLKRAAMKMFQGALTRSFERWAEHVTLEPKHKQNQNDHKTHIYLIPIQSTPPNVHPRGPMR